MGDECCIPPGWWESLLKNRQCLAVAAEVDKYSENGGIEF